MPENSTESKSAAGVAGRGGGGDRPGFAGSKAFADLKRALRGDLRADALTRGLYSTDASIYQVRPLAVVLPRSVDDIAATLRVAREEGIPVTPRGAGTSQAGQAVGSGIVVDTSQAFSRLVHVDSDDRTATVEPGLVLDRLNAALAPTGLFFPVDVATSSRATLGGMAGNNSAGARSIRYGMMADNVRAIEGLLADGTRVRLGRAGVESSLDAARVAFLSALRKREAEELARRIPKVLRHVAGYGLHRMREDGSSLADLLVGSEGTLAFFTSLELQLSDRPRHRVLGVCHFADLHAALDAVQHIVALAPSAVELTDGSVIGLARENDEFAPRVERFVQGTPGALLFVEFAGDEAEAVTRSLEHLESLAAVQPGPVVRVETPESQANVWAVRKAGMNIVMSGRARRKPVSIIEDCAIPLDRLAEWGDRLQAIFRSHEVDGTWYAHASVGCLHVRPSLDLKEAPDVGLLRAIADETFELVRALGGSHSGEHGDGRLRSEFIEPMLGSRLTDAFAEIKKCFDPEGVLNPGIIVAPQSMDDRASFRYDGNYRPLPVVPTLDWSADDGLLTATERCNNNGACRKLHPGVMCPSYRATREEVDTPRGRANTLRLALTGQLGAEGLASDAVHEALDLCVGCKACRRECPMGVDVARLKVEALARRHEVHGVPRRTRLFADLPRLAPRVARLGVAANRLTGSPVGGWIRERAGIAADLPVPLWASEPFLDSELMVGRGQADVLLFADTFNRWFEPENLRAAVRVMEHRGAKVCAPAVATRPLCCGRTYLSAGLVADARTEMKRSAEALIPFIADGGVVVGLEPSCILTFRDEAAALLPQREAELLAGGTLLFEEYLERSDAVTPRSGRSPWLEERTIHVHGHCHQKAFDVDGSVPSVLKEVSADVRSIESGCCGLAGSFGYELEHREVSTVMGELDLAPAVRNAEPEDLIVADGFSCRHQIAHLTGRQAVHAAIVLDRAIRSS